MNGSEGAHRHDQTTLCIMRDGDCSFEFVSVAQADRRYLHSKRWCHGLDRAQSAAAGRTGLADDDSLGKAGHNLLEQLKPFSTDAEFKQGEARGITARPRQTRDEARANRVDG